MKRRRLIVVAALFCLALAVGLFGRELQRERRFSSQIRIAAKRYDVDPLLVRAVVWKESRFNANASGNHGELGLMQIQDDAAREWAEAESIRTYAHAHCADPGTNTMAGTFYLGKLLKRYARTDDPVPYALADYNAGRGNVLRWNGGAAGTNSAVFIQQISYPQTKAYVRSVMRRAALYRFLASLGWEF